MTNNTDFFANAPENYEVPKSEGKYMKFKNPGKYKFRILERPIFGWLGWQIGADGKDHPVRYQMNDRPTDTSNLRNGRVDHFWAMPVYDFNTGKVCVLELTQKTIQQAVEGYARDEDWGSPLNYNLSVTREGTGRDDTKYQVMALPHGPLPQEATEAWEQIKKDGFDINALYQGGDPFEPNKVQAEHEAEAQYQGTAAPEENSEQATVDAAEAEELAKAEANGTA